MVRRSLSISVLLMTALIIIACASLTDRKITGEVGITTDIHVVDEQGNAIQGADV